MDKPLLPDVKTKTLNALKSGFSREKSLHLLTKNTRFTIHTLTLRVRNRSSIGACAPEEISELGKTGESSQTKVINGATVSTIVGMRPTFIRMDGITDEDYSEGMRESFSKALKLETMPTEHVVVLCGEGISVDKVSQTGTKLG